MVSATPKSRHRYRQINHGMAAIRILHQQLADLSHEPNAQQAALDKVHSYVETHRMLLQRLLRALVACLLAASEGGYG